MAQWLANGLVVCPSPAGEHSDLCPMARQLSSLPNPWTGMSMFAKFAKTGPVLVIPDVKPNIYIFNIKKKYIGASE